MWPFRTKVKQRRLEVRKNIPAGTSIWARFRGSGAIGSLPIAIGFYVGVLALLLWPADPLDYRVGQYVPRDIHARVTFKVLLAKEKAERIDEARKTRPAAFKLDTDRLAQIRKGLSSLPRKHVAAATQPARAWADYAKEPGKKAYDKRVAALVEELRQLYLVSAAEAKIQFSKPPSTGLYVSYPGGGAGPVDLSSRLIGQSHKQDIADEVDRLVKGFDVSTRGAIRDYLTDELADGRPLYVYDNKAAAEQIARSVRAIEADPPMKPYQAGDVLARASQTEPLGEADLRLLQLEHEQFAAIERTASPVRLWARGTGRAAIPLLAIILLCYYITRHESHLVREHWRVFVIAGVLLGMLAVGRAMISVPGLNPNAVVACVIVSALLMTIAYDQRFALVLSAFLSLLMLLQLRGDVTMLLVLIAGSATAVVRLHEIRTRSKLIEIGAVSGVVVFVVILAAGAAKSVPWKFLLTDGIWAAGFALLAGFLVQGILPLVEKLFRTATSMTLLEWCDASKPLLKRLAMQCPGTYNHSLQLGAMCETAADVIGARGLLARVGAYYHDVGKTNKPEYFVENQADGPSKHEKLSPAMSLLIIIGHVKDGIEMAREYGLPHILGEFIETHHGTTLVQYFYHAATEQRKGEAERAPDEVEFRYPGPKPSSKEAAILLLADASESSVRAMTDPAPGRIEGQVHNVVNQRLMDGQLDNCSLTLRDVHQVEASLTKSLRSIYHARISYPTPTGKNAKNGRGGESPRPE